MGSGDDAALRLAGQDDLDRMRLRRPVDRQPAATLGAEDQRASLLADEGQPVRVVDRARPDARVQLLELSRHCLDVSHETDLREAEQLLAAEATRPSAFVEAAVRDQLHDASGRIPEVAGEGVPEREV